MPLAVLALAIGAFGIGTAEFGITGLLPAVADEFAVSVPTAGHLTSGYALGVVVSAPVLALLSTRFPPRVLLTLLMGLFTAGNAICAAAPTWTFMLTGRLVSSLAHAAFFGIGSVVAARTVAPRRQAAAISLMFTGLTVANVIGVPAGTWLGQQAGWRITFLAIAGLGLLSMVATATLVPGDIAASRPHADRSSIRRELEAFRKPSVCLAMAMTVLGFGGVFASLTYLAPMMTEVAGFADTSLTWLLVLFGFGMVLGNLAGGRLADRALMPSILTALTALSLTLALFTATAYSKTAAAITLVFIGAFGFATVPPLQKYVLDKTSRAPTLASAVNIGAFNLGNALAAWLGGLVLDAGAGHTAPNWVGALLAAGALGLAVVSTTLKPTAPQPAPSSEEHPRLV